MIERPDPTRRIDETAEPADAGELGSIWLEKQIDADRRYYLERYVASFGPFLLGDDLLPHP